MTEQDRNRDGEFYPPKVAVVIPCRNEQGYIERCVRSVMRSDYDILRFQVIVADGESDDGTVEILDALCIEFPNLIKLNNQARVTPIGLNLGLKFSDADIKIILGAHSEVAPDFISENVKALHDDPAVGCAGGILEHVYEDETAELIGLAMTSKFGVGNAGFRTGHPDGYVDTVAFGAYRKEVFEKVGYFDEELVRNQDDEFNFRVIKGGFKILLRNSINCKYFVRSSFGKLWRQYLQYGYWKVWVNMKHNTVTTLRQVVPLLFVSYLIFGFLISMMLPVLGYLYLAGILFYLLVGFSVAIKLKQFSRDTFKLVATFILLHTSYGWGYLVGVVRFALFRMRPSNSFGRMSR